MVIDLRKKKRMNGYLYHRSRHQRRLFHENRVLLTHIRHHGPGRLEHKNRSQRTTKANTSVAGAGVRTRIISGSIIRCVRAQKGRYSKRVDGTQATTDEQIIIITTIIISSSSTCSKSTNTFRDKVDDDDHHCHHHHLPPGSDYIYNKCDNSLLGGAGRSSCLPP